MTTLLSANESESITLKMTGYILQGGQRLICGETEEVNKAEKFLDKNGFGGLYFSPTDPVETYDSFDYECAIDGDCHGILFSK